MPSGPDGFRRAVGRTLEPTQKVAEKYGTWQKKSRYGRSYMGIVRTTFLIDRNGKVAKRWDNVKVDDHAAEVLAAVDAL